MAHPRDLLRPLRLIALIDTDGIHPVIQAPRIHRDIGSGQGRRRDLQIPQHEEQVPRHEKLDAVNADGERVLGAAPHVRDRCVGRRGRQWEVRQDALDAVGGAAGVEP